MVEFPDRDEIVIAVVKKILPYGAFCSLPEYNIEAFMHISQVASGWVKNIHEFLSENQRLVVKVHHINPEKNQVDISLKSVTEDEKRRKLDSIKRGKRGEKLLEIALKNSKLKKPKLEECKEIIEEHYDDVLSCLEDCLDNGLDSLKDIDLPKKLKEEIVSLAKISIKKSKIVLGGVITLTCHGVDGVDAVKNILSVENKNFDCSYLGAPKYKYSFVCDDYKKGEKQLSKLLSEMEKKANKNNCSFSFESEDS